jgi:thioredoxin 1
MKDILIVFIVALVLGSVVNGMPPPANNSQPAPLQTNNAEPSQGQTDFGSSAAPIPLDSANDSNFQNQVINQSLPVLVDFYTQTCPHCKNMEPILGRLAGEYPTRLKIIKVDVMESPSVALKYDVASVPAFVLFDQGKAVASLVGEIPRRQLLAAIEPYLHRQDAPESSKIQTPPAASNQAG